MIKTNSPDKKKLVLNYAYVLLLILFIYLFFSYLVPFFMPFLIGLMISFVNAPLVKVFERNLKFNRKIAVFLSMLFTISLIGLILILGVTNIYRELIALQNNLSTYYQNTIINANALFAKVLEYFNNLPPNITVVIMENLKSFEEKSAGFLNTLILWLMTTISSIPRMFVFIIVALLSAFFFSSDSKAIIRFILKQVPKRFRNRMEGFRSDALSAFLGYLKAVLILMSITCIEVSIGLLIINADYAILMGVLIGIAEVIPLFGTGIIMVPWIVWSLFMGNTFMAIGLIVIFVVGVLIRQLVEPKVFGSSLGLHPLATLIAMYVGLQIFGFSGLFIGPFTLVVLKSVQKSRILTVWQE